MTRNFGLASCATAAALVGILVAPTPASAETLTIGTGGKGGVYYPAGRGICRLVNEAQGKTGLNCRAVHTKGSIYNVRALKAKKLQIAVVQSDWHYHGYNGSAKFKKDGPFKAMRSLFSLHAEPFTVVARADAGIKRFADLAGKRVNVSNPGSGARATMIEVMKVMGWRARTFSQVTQLDTGAQAKALCEDRIDVMVYTVGHPSETVKQATGRCNARLINVNGPAIDQLIKNNPYYTKVWIPAGMYKNNTHRIRTFGVNATVIASTAVPDATVGKLVQAVFANLRKFRTLHPALKILNDEAMIKDGLSAPLHPGAAAFYKKAGLL